MFQASKNTGDAADIFQLIDYLEEEGISLGSVGLDKSVGSDLLSNPDLMKLEEMGMLILEPVV